MKPLLINTYDKWGAGNACIRLHKGLLNRNIDSEMVVLHKSNDEVPNIIKFKHGSRSYYHRSHRFLKNKFQCLKYRDINQNLTSDSDLLGYFSFPFSNYDITDYHNYNDFDIVNLHWVANFLNYPTFFKNNSKPLVWTLHDQNPFIGGEHYLEDIVGIDAKGFPLKRTKSQKEIDFNKRVIEIKQRAYSYIKNLTVVSPSQWLANEAQKSTLFSPFNVVCIPNSLDVNIFIKRDKEYSRKLLGINNTEKVLLFVADNVNSIRKGFQFLQKAVTQIEETVTLMVLGLGDLPVLNKIKVKKLGYIDDKKLLSHIYSASDYFIIPSLLDNLPNTVMESLCCGTPVIGFNVGGISDMVKHGDNGFLCDEISAFELSRTINEGLGSIDIFDNLEISNQARLKYDQKIQAKAYVKLYTQILDAE